jgi:hypothetical protein
MRRLRRLCDRGHLDKARWIAVLVTLGCVGSAGALDPRDPCRNVRVEGFGQLSCPQFNRLFTTLNDLLAESVGRSLPLLAASAGFVYRYDSESDAFERETAIPGQLYLETPYPVGKHRWNVSLSYQYVAFDAFNGESLDALSDVHPPIRLRVKSSSAGTFDVPATIPAFEITTRTHQVAVSATYGVTSDLDVNLTVPVVYADSSMRGRGRILVGGEPVCPVASGCTVSQRQSGLGLGDVFLRGKFRFLRRDWAEMAGGLVLRLPTADADALHGSGTTQIAPLLYAAGASLPLGPSMALRPYLNGGVNFDASDVTQSEGRWSVGLDVAVADRATVGLGVLARYPFARIGPPGVFDVPRCRTTDVGCTSAPPAPLFGFTNERPNFYDASFGLRVNLWRDVLIGFANALLPLNDAGLRAGVIPLLGVEATF